MRIEIINPDYGMTDGEIGERLRALRRYVSPEAELSMRCLARSTVCLDSMADAVLAGPEILRMAQVAEREGADAVVLYCFSDPALDACREVLSIPVVGAGQSACLAALTVSRQFGILVSDEKRVPEKRLFPAACGIDPGRVLGYRAADLAGRDPRRDIPWTIDRLEDAARPLLERDGAQAVVLGCLSFLGMAEELSARLGVPVIDAAAVSVAAAEALARLRLSTSKRAYPLPPKGTRALGESHMDIP